MEQIYGILFKHGDDDYSIWYDFKLSEEDEKIISSILRKYETDGVSERGTLETILK